MNKQNYPEYINEPLGKATYSDYVRQELTEIDKNDEVAMTECFLNQALTYKAFCLGCDPKDWTEEDEIKNQRNIEELRIKLLKLRLKNSDQQEDNNYRV